MNKLVIILLLFGWAAAPDLARSQAQKDSKEEVNYGSGNGLQVLLTNSGFGIGGYLSRALSSSTSFLLDVNVGAAKDEREARFFRFGSSFVPGKANYLLVMPLQAGVSVRLFRDEIEDNFRPFMQLTAGPTLGWQYPYFDDCNGNGNLDQMVDCNGDGQALEEERTYGAFRALARGSARFGAGATIAVGAYFGESSRTTQGIRLGYSFNYFPQGFRLMERRVEDTTRSFIGSPTITIIFGRLLTGSPTR